MNFRGSSFMVTDLQERKIIKEFDGNYKRKGEIWIQKAECSICGNENICIASDGSEGEYNVAYICETCVRLEMAKLKK